MPRRPQAFGKRWARVKDEEEIHEEAEEMLKVSDTLSPTCSVSVFFGTGMWGRPPQDELRTAPPAGNAGLLAGG